jgi:dUTP pyrophosphatase
MFVFESVNDGKLPCKITYFSVGFDLCVNEDIELKAGETYILPLGVKIQDYKQTTNYIDYLELHPRSSLRAKGVISGVGVIDADYREEIKMIVFATKRITFKRGDRVAQLIARHSNTDLMRNCEVLNDFRIGGIGSTSGGLK